MPAIGDCPVDPGRFDDDRRACAVNIQQGLTIDRIDNWRDSESRYHRPFEHDSNGDSIDGDYGPSRWTGYTDFWIREDGAPATQWTGERHLLEYCCGPRSRIGDPNNFVDNSSK
eukprot:8252484-Pyramimonas_sp.AAC.1